jgi:hypothetical protein
MSGRSLPPAYQTIRRCQAVCPMFPTCEKQGTVPCFYEMEAKNDVKEDETLKEPKR